MIYGQWKSAVITIATDDDLTPEVDLGKDFSYVLVLIPTITSSTVTIHVAKGSGGTFFPVYAFDADATGDFAHATTAATTLHAVVFFIGGAQYIKIATGSAQGADETFYVRGC